MTVRKPSASFVTTFAASASLVAATALGGCDHSVAFSDECDFGDPGCSEPCPASAPGDGTTCHQEGQSCSYGECDAVNATCHGGDWSVYQEYSCNPPFIEPEPEPDCPVTIPTNGSACDNWYGSAYSCDYIDPFCEAEVDATCGVDGIWQVDSVACNPPPPDFCQTVGTSEECIQTPACRWLVPGCGQPALLVEGCFSVYDCTSSSCAPNEECFTGIVDPCWNLDCRLCAAEASVCLPSH